MLTSYDLTRDAPLAIVGAGPVGLAAAAKCVASGVPFLLLEAGEDAGAAVKEWGHVRLFSPWVECIDADAAALLAGSGWRAPAGDGYPDGRSLIEEYLKPLADLPAIARNVRYGLRVAEIRRARGAPGFTVTSDGGEEIHAGAIVDASGTWNSPRRLLRIGPPASIRVHDRVPDVRSRAMRARLAGKRVAIIGSGHSGMTLLIDLTDWGAAAEIVWIRRGPVIHSGAPLGPGSARLKLERAAELAAGRAGVHVVHGGSIDQLAENGRMVRMTGRAADGTALALEADYVFTAIGFDPDHRIAGGLRLDLDPDLAAPRKLAALIDPRKHSCSTVPRHGWEELAHPEPGYFIAGAKSYGRAPNFALTTGYAQLDSILAHIAPAAFPPAGPRPSCAAACG